MTCFGRKLPIEDHEDSLFDSALELPENILMVDQAVSSTLRWSRVRLGRWNS